jgi:hypothetical protein
MIGVPYDISQGELIRGFGHRRYKQKYTHTSGG